MIQTIHHPQISILLPVYNAEKYLSACLDSLLNQIFSNFEIIAINDGSSDSSLSILEAYANRDYRVKIFSNESNLKIVKTLNKGLELAAAPLVARMDADDIAFPQRIENQYRFMNEHPEVSISGTGVQVLGTDKIWDVPESNNMIRATLCFNSPILHPTAIYNKETILSVGGYSENAPYAEDYDLWHRLSMDKNIIFANINTPLLYYRITTNEKPFSYQVTQKNTANWIREKQLNLLGINVSSKEISLHSDISSHKYISNYKQLAAAYRWLRTIARSPDASEDLINLCWRYWKNICRSSPCRLISYPLYALLPSPQRFETIIKFLSIQMSRTK